MRYYVDGSAPTNGSGESWDDPMNDVRQSAMSAYNSDEIWVKEHGGLTIDNEIHINTGVDLCCGFDAGLTGVEGDVLSRSGYTRLIPSAHGFRCLDISNTSGNDVSRLWATGFVVNGDGGGIRIDDSHVYLNQVVVSGCQAGTTNEHDGGGIHVSGTESYISMVACTIFNNRANTSGGGVFVADIPEKIELLIEDSLIMGNSCGHRASSSHYGGGICCDFMRIDRSYIRSNRSIGGVGGGNNCSSNIRHPAKKLDPRHCYK